MIYQLSRHLSPHLLLLIWSETAQGNCILDSWRCLIALVEGSLQFFLKSPFFFLENLVFFLTFTFDGQLLLCYFPPAVWPFAKCCSVFAISFLKALYSFSRIVAAKEGFFHTCYSEAVPQINDKWCFKWALMPIMCFLCDFETFIFIWIAL